MDRRRFLEIAGAACGGMLLGGCAQSPQDASAKAPMASAPLAGKRGIVYVGHNPDPQKALLAALGAAGGLGAIIKPGSSVVLKPNAAWARTPEQAATTDPRLVSEMVKLCKQAGASRVTVFEYTIDNPPRMVFAISGIGAAAQQAGADVVMATSQADFALLEIPRGKLLKTATLAHAVLDADVVINMPKAKRHSQTELTLGLKNLMGVVWDRQAWHRSSDLHQCIADYATAVPVSLTVMDASRVLLTNGPKGPGETKDPQQVIVSFDPVAGDSYACTLFGMTANEVPYITRAGALGLGEASLSKIKVLRA